MTHSRWRKGIKTSESFQLLALKVEYWTRSRKLKTVQFWWILNSCTLQLLYCCYYFTSHIMEEPTKKTQPTNPNQSRNQKGKLVDLSLLTVASSDSILESLTSSEHLSQLFNCPTPNFEVTTSTQRENFFSSGKNKKRRRNPKRKSHINRDISWHVTVFPYQQQPIDKSFYWHLKTGLELDPGIDIVFEIRHTPREKSFSLVKKWRIDCIASPNRRNCPLLE